MADFDFAFYFSIFLRRLPLFLVVLVVVGAIGATVTFILPSVYQATAKILVESPQIPTTLAASTVPTGAVEQFQIIQEDVLSRESLLALANRFALYGNGNRPPDADIVDDIKARLSIDPTSVQAASGDAAATVFQISFKAPAPQVAADVTNDLVRMILKKDVELRTGRANDTVQFFSQEVSRLNDEIKTLDGQILAFKDANINALPDSVDFRRNQQSTLQQRLFLLAQEETTLRRRQSDLQSRRVVATTPGSPAQRSLADLQQTIIDQSAVFSADSPTMKALHARLASLQAQVTDPGAASGGDVNAALVPSDTELELGDIKDRLAAIAHEEAAIGNQNDELGQSLQATPGNETALNDLQRNRQNLQAQYDAAVARLADASTGQQIEMHLKGERLSLIESAVPPQSRMSPKRKLLLIGTAVAAFVLALGAVALPEFFNRSVRRPVELINKLSIRPFVTVPYIHTTGDRNRRRLTTIVAIALVVGITPLVATALHKTITADDIQAAKGALSAALGRG